MRNFAIVLGLCLAIATPLRAAAQTPPSPPHTIAISANAHVDYRPDLARLSLGVRAIEPTAAAATASVNERGQHIIAALHELGIKDAAIVTSGYSVYYQEPVPGADSESPALAAPATVPGPPRPPLPPVRRSGRAGYVATLSFDITTAVERAGPAIDAAIKQGANQSFGVSFGSSRADALYLEALSKATQAARAQAGAIAAAAGITIAGVQNITVGGGFLPGNFARLATASAADGAPISAGTQRVDATVQVVFNLR